MIGNERLNLVQGRDKMYMQASILEWLDSSNEKYGDKVAVCDDDCKITFKQYHDKAIGIARAIIDIGLMTKNAIAVYLEKSAKVLVSFIVWQWEKQ